MHYIGEKGEINMKHGKIFYIILGLVGVSHTVMGAIGLLNGMFDKLASIYILNYGLIVGLYAVDVYATEYKHKNREYL